MLKSITMFQIRKERLKDIKWLPRVIHTTTVAAEMSSDGRYFCFQSLGSFTLFRGSFTVNTLTYGGNKALDLESQYVSLKLALPPAAGKLLNIFEWQSPHFNTGYFKN